MIRFLRPAIPEPEDWLPFLEDAYGERRFTNFGPLHERLEDALTARIGRSERRAVLASSATSALTATLVAMGVEGSVIIPSFSFPATLQAVRQAGCTPVVLDVDAETWELAPQAVLDGLGGRDIGAVMPVRAFGFCRDLDRWDEFASRHGIPVIVDSAAALGGRLDDGTPVGAQATAEVFSMHATKVFAIGEGGVAFVPDEYASSFRSALNFGLPAEGTLRRGFNGKLSEFHCAVGLAMLERIEGDIARRSEIAASYRERLSGFEQLGFPADVGQPPWQVFPVLLPDGVESPQIVDVAAKHGLELRGYYRPPLHAVTGEGSESDTCPTSEHLSEHVICLPVYSDMTDIELDDVIQRVSVTLGTVFES